MARKPNRMIPTNEVQGEGSFIELRRYLWGEWQDLDAKVDAGEINENQRGERLMALQIVKWNWTDEENKPLPLPKDDPDVFKRLTATEMMFLYRTIQEVEQEDQASAKRGGQPADVHPLDGQGSGTAGVDRAATVP